MELKGTFNFGFGSIIVDDPKNPSKNSQIRVVRNWGFFDRILNFFTRNYFTFSYRGETLGIEKNSIWKVMAEDEKLTEGNVLKKEELTEKNVHTKLNNIAQNTLALGRQLDKNPRANSAGLYRPNRNPKKGIYRLLPAAPPPVAPAPNSISLPPAPSLGPSLSE